MTLQELKPGQSARIVSVGGEGALRQHFLDMGVIPGAEVTVTKLAPLGDRVFDDLRIRVNRLSKFAAGPVFIGGTKHFGSALNHNRRSIYSAFYVRQYFRLHSA